MAKPKITVSFNGTVIGSRRTDRPYTHALVLHDFDPEAVRKAAAREWPEYGVQSATQSHAHAIESIKPDYKYASVVRGDERLACERIAAMSLDEYIEECRARHFARYEKLIASRLAEGARVLSYHGRHDLALAALGQAQGAHLAYDVAIVAVDAA